MCLPRIKYCSKSVLHGLIHLFLVTAKTLNLPVEETEAQTLTWPTFSTTIYECIFFKLELQDYTLYTTLLHTLLQTTFNIFLSRLLLKIQ